VTRPSREESEQMICDALLSGAPIIESRYLWDDTITLVRSPGEAPVVVVGPTMADPIRRVAAELRARIPTGPRAQEKHNERDHG